MLPFFEVPGGSSRTMLDLMGYKKYEAFSNMAVVGVVLAFEAGGAIVPFKGWQLGLANQFSEVVGMPINYVTFMVVGFIISTLTLLVYLLVVSKVFKVDFSRLATFDVTALDNADKKMDTRQKIVLWINGAVMFFILLASLLPSGTGLYKFFNSTLTVAGVFSLGAILMSIISLKDGEPLIDFHAVASTSVRWDVLFRIGSAMVLAAAFVAPETGIMDWCGIGVRSHLLRQELLRIPAHHHPHHRRFHERLQQHCAWRHAHPGCRSVYSGFRCEPDACRHHAHLCRQHGDDPAKRRGSHRSHARELRLAHPVGCVQVCHVG